MDITQFMTLEVGDLVTYQYRVLRITQVGKQYNFATKPATQVTWKVWFDNGTNAQWDDDLSGIEDRR